MGCILSELLTSTPIPARCGGGVFAFNAALVQKTVDDSVKLYVCLMCLPYMSALCVNAALVQKAVDDSVKLHGCLMCLPYLSALSVTGEGLARAWACCRAAAGAGPRQAAVGGGAGEHA